MKNSVLFLLIFFGFQYSYAQNNKDRELFPVFPDCKNMDGTATEACFYNRIQDFVYTNFKVPATVAENDFKGVVTALFEVDTAGVFRVLYVDALYPELITETKRVFGQLPKVAPPTYNGNATYAKYTIKIAIPLVAPVPFSRQPAVTIQDSNLLIDRNKELTEFDSIISRKFENPQLKSQLNIPFSHSYYATFDAAMNQVGANNHTGSKPYTYTEVGKYYDLEKANQQIMKNKTGWWGRKFWNENLVAIQGEGYWLTINPIFDVRIGKSSPSDVSYTYQNTRGIQVQGAIGKELTFTTTIYESQGRFADYYNRYANSIKPSGGNPAIIPGIGIAKEFKTDGYDFPSADANLTYTPSRFFNLQLGYGRNFIGDGYRSLLESDGASPYPYFKINTTFWKVKYTNTYMWLKDVRNEVTADRTYATKFSANHYLSWNVTKRLNLGFFESVVWSNSNDRGFDVNFVNPIIFYRSVEFSSSSKSGNALLGMTGKYKINNQMNVYGQFLLDEFSVGDITGGQQSWKNKYGYQLGAKYYDAFQVKNLLLQLEYNHVRPYVYQHSNILTNYGHNNQSLGHQWGGNFKEVVAIARYHKGRWSADAKFTVGKRGLDFDTATDSLNYGGNPYKNYNDNRPYDTGVKVGQGNATNVFIADLQTAYLINPTTNIKVFASLIYRNFDPLANNPLNFKETTTWFSLGIRADIFNMYYDF